MQTRTYRYEKLFVSCVEPRYFDPQDPQALRAAVEHLRPIVNEVNRKFVGVVADAGVIPAGKYKLHARAMLTIDQITGLTPAEVWAKFDANIDAQVAYFEKRSATEVRPSTPTEPPEFSVDSVNHSGQ